MIDQISAALKVFSVQMKPHMGMVITLLVVLILILFIVFTLLVIRAKKNTFITPIHTVKLEERGGSQKADGSLEPAHDAFKLPPFLYGFSEPFERYLSSGSFAKLFFKAQEFIERSFQDKYVLPWYAILGTEQSGKTQLLNSLESYLGSNIPDFEQVQPRDYCQFSFFNDAVTLNLKGTFFLHAGDTKFNDSGFRAFLLLLSRYRMKRPLNGLILTIPLTEVFGSDALSKLDIQKRAIAIKDKLNVLQDFLGVRVPVYVFFTKLDLIPGFDQFVETIPDGHMHNSIGWSIDQWGKRSVEEGFVGIEKHFQKLLTYMLINIDNPEKAGKIFAFTNDVTSLNEMLTFYLNQIFLEDLSNTAPMLRGFYFTGSINKNVLFVRDIVQEKIFIEQGIVYPLVSFGHDKRSLFRKTQVGISLACVVLGAGFWRAKYRFDLQKDAIIPVLHNFVGLSNQLKSARSNEVQKMKYISEETLRNLTKLSEVTSKRFMFFSVFIPVTWISPYRSHLKMTIHQVVQTLIIGSLYTHLSQKARDLLNINLLKLPSSTNIGALIFPTSSREFAALRYYVKEVKLLSENIQKYNYLGGGTAIKEFDDIFQYCFGEALPIDFKDNFHKINKFLGHRDLPKIDLSMHQNKFRQNLAFLFQHFYNALFDHNNTKSLINQLKTLEKTLNPMDPELFMTINDLRDASIILSDNVDVLAGKKTLWVDENYFDPGIYLNDEFSELIKDVQKHYLFGENFAHVILLRLNQGFEDLKKALSHFDSFLYSDLSQESLEKKALSEGIFVLERSIRFLKFMPAWDGSTLQTYKSLRPEEIICWDAFNVNLVYSKINTPLETKMLPSVLVPKIKIIFEKAVGSFIKNTLMQGFIKERMLDETAKSTEIESYLRDRKDFIKTFGVEWIKILTLMKKQDIEFVFFRDQLNKTAIYFLTLIDQLLELDALYLPKSLSNWDGKSGASNNAFGTMDKAALEKYLDVQLSRMKFLKELAEPLVLFLNSNLMDTEFNDKELVLKWEKIAEVIDQRSKGQTAGLLTDFEDFVKKDMNSMTAEKVYDAFDGQISDIHSIDFFKRRLAMIKNSMLSRSEELLRAESIEHYNTLRQFFIKHLKNKFPFSKTIEEGASLDDVKKFFELYDKAGGAPEKILRKIEGLGNYKHAMHFIKGMHQLREVLSTFIEGKSNSPEIQIEWDFRINRDREYNGDRVMDFTFKMGAEKEIVFISREKKYSRWVFGDKIEIGFGWAKTGKKDAPQPTTDSVQPQLKVIDKKAIFIYRDPWSLFALLHTHKIKGDILKFEVPQDSGDKFVGYNKMRLLKVGLSPQDPKQYIEIPNIPTEASELLSEESNSEDEEEKANTHHSEEQENEREGED